MSLPGEIVPGTDQDGDDIQRIMKQVGNFTNEEIAMQYTMWQDFLNQTPEGVWYFFVVYREGGKTLGFLCYGPRPLTHTTYDVYWLAVDPSQQGRGIGKALLRYLEDQVSQHNGHLITIETSNIPSYAATRAFYLSAGYELEATIRDNYGPGDDMVIFTRRFLAGVKT